MPFLAEKITGMLYQMLRVCSPQELLEGEPEDVKQKFVEQKKQDDEKMERKRRLKQKIIALGRMNAMLGNLRENSEVIL